MRRGLPETTDPVKDGCSLYEGVEYSQFWDGRSKRNLDTLEHLIVQSLLPAQGRRIIDVGCGFGRLADCYLDRFQQVIMMDGSISLLHQAMDTTGERAIYVAGDALHPPFRNSAFDAILLIRVFHHIQDSQACLSEMSRILCKDGRFIFNYLNKQNVSRVVQWLIGRNKENPFDAQTVGCGSTFISHHPGTVNTLLHETGFADIRSLGAGVLDRFAGSDGLSKHWIGLGEHWAPFLGRSRIAPWILCSAEVKAGSNLIDTGEINDLFQCPACSGSLCEKPGGYRCFSCEQWYPVNDGIFDFRIRY